MNLDVLVMIKKDGLVINRFGSKGTSTSDDKTAILALLFLMYLCWHDECTYGG